MQVGTPYFRPIPIGTLDFSAIPVGDLVNVQDEVGLGIVKTLTDALLLEGRVTFYDPNNAVFSRFKHLAWDIHFEVVDRLMTHFEGVLPSAIRGWLDKAGLFASFGDDDPESPDTHTLTHLPMGEILERIAPFIG